MYTGKSCALPQVTKRHEGETVTDAFQQILNYFLSSKVSEHERKWEKAWKRIFATATAHTVRRCVHHTQQFAMPDSHYSHYEIINICKKIAKTNLLRHILLCVHCRPSAWERRKRTMTHHVSTIRVHITNFNNTLEKKKEERKKRLPLWGDKDINNVLFVYSKPVAAERKGAPFFLSFLPPVVITWYLHVHTRAHLANKQIKQKNTLPDVYMYIMNTQNVHTATHTHTFAEFLRLLSFSTLTFPLASSTTVGKLWYKNETRTCTHACTQFFSLFLKTYVHARTRTEHLHFPLLSLFLPPLIFDLTHWHPSPWGREGNGSSPCESSTRRSAAQS